MKLISFEMRYPKLGNLTKAIVKIFSIWAVSCVMLILLKYLFFAVYFRDILENEGFLKSLADITVHGFRMDSTVAAYLSIIPSVLTAASLCVKSKWIRKTELIWYGLISVLISAVYVVDIALFDYWKFRLDATPLFYFMSSPSAAMASVTSLQIIAGTVCLILLAAVVFIIYRFTVYRINPCCEPDKRRYLNMAVSLIASCLLIIPLRGGVTVSTTNLSSAYFSPNQGLNQAAINPGFSLLYSLTHPEGDDNRYNYMDERIAFQMFDNLKQYGGTTPDSLSIKNKPDIYIIILESFSSHLFPSLGGEPVATRLDSIFGEGISFSEIYASGFRTDRGIPAILSGFPSIPTTSVMKDVAKAASLPSVASKLRENNYNAAYYYGGDACFTNMQAYLVNTGFSKIVSDKDFPISKKLSKWGAHDDVLLEKVKDDIKASGRLKGKPNLRVIQTSSSHEPFEVPYHDNRFNGYNKKNAFAFTDSCVADFIKFLKSDSARWNNSLIVVTADHYGAYPEKLNYIPDRFHIPLAVLGGALTKSGIRITGIGSQTDIPATLLGMLGIDSGQFKFSKNILDASNNALAIFSGRNEAVYLDKNNMVCYNIDTGKTVIAKGNDPEGKLKLLKGYMQTLYSHYKKLGSR